MKRSRSFVAAPGRQFDRQVVELLCAVLADEDEPATTFAVGG